MGAQATKIQALETQLSTQTTTIEGKFADLNSAQATHIQALEAQLSTQTTTIEGQATAVQTLEAHLDAKLDDLNGVCADGLLHNEKCPHNTVITMCH